MRIAAEVAGADDCAALRLLRNRALDNTERRRSGRPMQGQIFTVDPRHSAVPED